jgi:hypothetical protein
MGDHAGHHQVRVVEGGAVGVHERVAELAALVDRTRRLGSHMAGDPAGKGELPEQLSHPVDTFGDAGVDLGVGALEVGVGHESGSTVTGAGDVDDVGVPFPDDAVQMGVDEVEPRGGAPVAEQPGLDVFGGEVLAQQRVVQQVDLADGQVVGGPPVGVDQVQLVVGEGGGQRLVGHLAGHLAHSGHGG